MPFKSLAQRRLFYARKDLKRFIPEFEAATPKGKRLPERIKKKKLLKSKKKNK